METQFVPQPAAHQPAIVSPTSSVKPTGCCPPFDPATYHEKEITWHDKPFVKVRVHSFLHIPIDMGRKVTEAMKLIAASHATPEQGLMLSDERSAWSNDLLIDTKGPVLHATMVPLSGTFLTRVYEGPYKDAPKWRADMIRYVAEKGRTASKIYFAYTTCPACAKAYGKNYVVLFAEVPK